MECLYCGTPLAPLRVATDGVYCCEDHRIEHAVENSPSQYLFLLDPPNAQGTAPAVPQTSPAHLEPAAKWLRPVVKAGAEDHRFQFAQPGLLPWSPVPRPREPKERNQEFAPRLAAARPVLPAPVLVPYTACLQPEPAPPFVHRLGSLAIRHWKLYLALVPLAFVVLIESSPKRAPVQKQSVPATSAPMFSGIRNSIKRRAAVQISDDFRAGLDDWESNRNLATSWTYDDAGFVRPGALALYRPTMDLEDYTVEFLGQIEQKGMGVAFRIMDWDHYYALQLIQVKQGQLPGLEVVRYAVEGNREVARTSRRFPVTFRDTSLCRFRLDVRGNQFTLINQGQIVDDWTDDRYPKGGVGFFCGKGERARLRWVEVSHQNDAVGRLCALLAQ